MKAQYDDPDLIKALKKRDPKAQNKAYEANRHISKSLLYHYYSLSDFNIQSFYLECFGDLITTKIDTLSDESSSIGGWLRNCMTWKCNDMAGSKGFKIDQSSTDVDDTTVKVDHYFDFLFPEEINKERQKAEEIVSEALKHPKFSPKCREIYELKYVQELKWPEVDERLGKKSLKSNFAKGCLGPLKTILLSLGFDPHTYFN